MSVGIQEQLQDVLGDAYHIERELAGGGMSRVFLALERSLGRRVVVKLLPPEWASEVSAQRFQREINLTANLPHPHILPVLAAGSRDGFLYYISPYLEGESLRDRLRHGALPVEEGLQLLGEVADAIAFAHARGIVHRDIKPENILLQGGHAVLADFGIARALEAATDANITATGMSVGTPGYMAPEQLAGDSQVDARADIYSLAVVAYETLTGAPPFTGSIRQLTTAHLMAKPRDIRELNPAVPESAAQWIMDALSKDPSARPADPAAFRATVRTAAPARRVGRKAVLLLGATAVAVMIAIAIFVMSGRTKLDPNKLFIVPFTTVGEGLEMWRSDIPSVLSHTFDGAGPLRTVPAIALLPRIRGKEDVDPQALAREFHAGLFIDGSLRRIARDSIELTLTLRDGSNGVRVAESTMPGELASIDRTIESASGKLLTEFGRARGLPSLRFASFGSSSMDAIKAFLRGEDYLYDLDFDHAREQFDGAVRIDPQFSLALRKLSFTIRYQFFGRDPSYREYLVRAMASARGLGTHDSLVGALDSLWFLASYGNAQMRRIRSTTERLLNLYGDDGESWYYYGNFLQYSFYEWAPGRPVTAAMARAAFEQSIALDSMRADAYGSAALMALADEDTVRAGPVLDACLRRVRRGVGRSTCAVLEAVLRRPSDPQTLALVDTAPTASVAQIYFGFADFPDQEQRAISFLRYIVDHREARSTRADIFEFAVPLYESLAQRGRGREAWKVGQGLREGPGGVADLALLGDFPEAEPIIRAMLRDTTIHYSATINWFAAHRDTTALREIGRRAERDLHSGNEDVRENGLYYLPLTEAWIRYARGDVAGALRTVKAISDTTCVRCFHNRLAEAEFLSAMGRDSAAAVVLGPTPIGPLSAALGNAWRLARAKVNARLSNNARAIEDYAFLARQWRDADETFQPRLREVQAALRSYDRMPDGRTRDDQGR